MAGQSVKLLIQEHVENLLLLGLKIKQKSMATGEILRVIIKT